MPTASDSWWERIVEMWFPDPLKAELLKIPTFIIKLVRSLMGK